MMEKGWWILVDKDGLIVDGEGKPKEELEYFAAIITFAILSLRKAIWEEMEDTISEISFKVSEKGLIFHILPLEESGLFLITAMPEDMPLGLIRLRTKELYDRAKSMVQSLKPQRRI